MPFTVSKIYKIKKECLSTLFRKGFVHSRIFSHFLINAVTFPKNFPFFPNLFHEVSQKIFFINPYKFYIFFQKISLFHFLILSFPPHLHYDTCIFNLFSVCYLCCIISFVFLIFICYVCI